MASAGAVWLLRVLLPLSVFVYLAVPKINYKSTDLARGWGEEVDWVHFDDAFALSKKLHKPVMLIIHNSWCAFCKAFKPRFKESREIIIRTDSFVMTNFIEELVGEGEIGVYKPDNGAGGLYAPDGEYLPRILFYDPNGTRRDDMFNHHGNRKFRHFYFTPEGLTLTMDIVLDTTSPRPPETTTVTTTSKSETTAEEANVTEPETTAKKEL